MARVYFDEAKDRDNKISKEYVCCRKEEKRNKEIGDVMDSDMRQVDVSKKDAEVKE